MNQPVSGVAPNRYQREQIERKFGMFLHFGINTFANVEWSDGTVPLAAYAPDRIDCEQWVKTAKEAGMQYVILTAKHHDGFCLWNTDTTEYSVKHTKNPVDVVEKLSKACKKYGIALGIYYSLWDRNAVCYERDFKNEYLPYMHRQLRELLENYGPVCELWLDGSWDKMSEEWELETFYDLVKSIQPACQIGINHTIGGHTKDPEERYLPANCREGDPIRMFPSDFRLWDPHPCGAQDPKIYTYEGKPYYMPFEMTICSREGFSWFFSEEYEQKPFLDVEEVVKNCRLAFSQHNNVVINMPPNCSGRLSEGDIKHLQEISALLFKKEK